MEYKHKIYEVPKYKSYKHKKPPIPGDDVYETYELPFKKVPKKFYTIEDAKLNNIKTVSVADCEVDNWIVTDNNYVTQICKINTMKGIKVIRLACGQYSTLYPIFAQKYKSRTMCSYKDRRKTAITNRDKVDKLLDYYIIFGRGWRFAHKLAFEGAPDYKKLDLDRFLRKFHIDPIYRKKVMKMMKDKFKDLQLDEQWIGKQLKQIVENNIGGDKKNNQLLIYAIDSIRELLGVDKDSLLLDKRQDMGGSPLTLNSGFNPQNLLNSTDLSKMPETQRKYLQEQLKSMGGNGKKSLEIPCMIEDDAVDFEEPDEGTN